MGSGRPGDALHGLGRTIAQAVAAVGAAVDRNNRPGDAPETGRKTDGTGLADLAAAPADHLTPGQATLGDLDDMGDGRLFPAGCGGST